MRILHTECSTGLGGQELRTLAESLEMARRGHQVTIAAPPESDLAVRAGKAGLRVEPVSFRLPRAASLVRQLLRLIEQDRIQVINTHGSVDSWTAAVAGRLSPLKPIVVRTRHKATPVSRSLRHRWLYQRLPHGVITTGTTIRDTLIAEQHVDPARIVSIPTGVDVSRFRPIVPDAALREQFGCPPGQVLVGTVAFLRSDKGLPDFLAAARAVLDARASARFVIVGDGPERASLVRTVRRLGLEGAVKLAGHREDIPQVLAAFDFFVLSSPEGEGVPQGLTQAMAMARPVVATNVGSVGDVVIDRTTGLLAQPKNPGELARHIVALMDDEALGMRCGRAARERIERHETLDHMASRTEEFYARLLAERHGRDDSEHTDGSTPFDRAPSSVQGRDQTERHCP